MNPQSLLFMPSHLLAQAAERDAEARQDPGRSRNVAAWIVLSAVLSAA